MYIYTHIYLYIYVFVSSLSICNFVVVCVSVSLCLCLHMIDSHGQAVSHCDRSPTQHSRYCGVDSVGKHCCLGTTTMQQRLLRDVHGLCRCLYVYIE